MRQGLSIVAVCLLGAACGGQVRGGSSGSGGVAGKGGTTGSAATGGSHEGGAGTGGSAAGAGIGGTGEPTPCDFLEEVAPATCNMSEEICNAVQARQEPGRFSIDVDVRLGQPDLSDDDLAVRRECFDDWFSQLGFEEEARWIRTRPGQGTISLSASWPEVVPVLVPAAVVSYSIHCGEALCAHCADLSEAQCPGDPFCGSYVIWPLRVAGDGCDPARFAECIPFEYGCAEAPGFVIDPSGQCWWDNGQCEPLVYLQHTLECGDAEDPLPGCGD